MKRARVYVCVDVEVNGDGALAQTINSVSSWLARSRYDVAGGNAKVEIVNASVYDVVDPAPPPHPPTV